MIVKGRARSGPAQLAAYLLRADGSERATILTPGVDEDDLYRQFMTWHVAGEATNGEKTLYHAQIAPEARYNMTPEQFLRAGEILARNLGMDNHPYIVVMHDGGDNPHAHVVFQRVDLETMKLWDNGFNYVKHESASRDMALEFKHDLVPGKHTKRDRKKQAEFPRGETNQAMEQQAKRLNLSTDERKAQITALRRHSDDAQAFKNALEDAGYLLAKGDQRGFVLVDGEGEVFSLSKFVTDIKKKAYDAFMAPIDRQALPSVAEAKAIQERRREEAPVKVEKPPQEASKFLAEQPPQTAPEAAPGPENSKFLPKKEEPQIASKFIGQEEAAARQEPPSKFLQPPEPQPQPAQELQKADPEAERRARESQRAAELRSEPEKQQQQPAEERAPEQTKLRQPLPSDPWMAQVGGVENLSQAHLESARKSYDKWALKEEFSFENYVSYVQRKWKDKSPPAAEAEATKPTELRSEAEKREQQPAEERVAPEQPKRRQPLPSDPWMVQVGGVENLSPAHLESARKSYDNWDLKDEFSFENYVSYVQRKWKDKELPPPAETESQKPARAPKSRYIQTPPAPKPEDWTEREIAPEFNQTNPQPEPARPRKEWLPPELHQLREKIWQEQVFKMTEHAEANSQEYKQAEQTTKNTGASKLEDFDIQQREARQDAGKEPQSFWRAALDRIINPVDETKKAAEEQERLAALQARQAQERRDYVKKLEEDRARELAALRARHLQEQADREKQFDRELQRQLSEKKQALKTKQPPVDSTVHTPKPAEGWTDRKLTEEFKGIETTPIHKPQPREGWTERKLTDDLKNADPDAERHQREKQRAAKLRAKIEAEEREKGLNREKEEGLGEGKD